SRREAPHGPVANRGAEWNVIAPVDHVVDSREGRCSDGVLQRLRVRITSREPLSEERACPRQTRARDPLVAPRLDHSFAERFRERALSPPKQAAVRLVRLPGVDGAVDPAFWHDALALPHSAVEHELSDLREVDRSDEKLPGCAWRAFQVLHPA